MPFGTVAPAASGAPGGGAGPGSRHGAGRESYWYTERLGPVHFTGKKGGGFHVLEWNKYGHDFGCGAGLEGAYVTGSFVGAVNASGHVLGNPPVHLHHIHVLHQPNNLDGWCGPGASITQRHGDSQCVDKLGGVGCLGQAFPAGCGALITAPIGVYAMVNDGRDPSTDNEPMDVWVDIALRWTAGGAHGNAGGGGGAQAAPAPAHTGHRGQSPPGHSAPPPSAAPSMRRVALRSFGSPFKMNADQSIYEPALFFAPAGRPSALWYEFAAPEDARFLWTTFHAHQRWFRTARLFYNVTSCDLGLGGAHARTARRKSTCGVKPLYGLPACRLACVCACRLAFCVRAIPMPLPTRVPMPLPTRTFHFSRGERRALSSRQQLF